MLKLALIVFLCVYIFLLFTCVYFCLVTVIWKVCELCSFCVFKIILRLTDIVLPEVKFINAWCFMRRCGLFYISTLVTITITRKEFVINFLMFKHNIFLLLVFVFFFATSCIILFLRFLILLLLFFLFLMLLARLCGLNSVSFLYTIF